MALPFELIGECLSYCDAPTLSTAALASRTVKGEADPYLWANLRLDKPGLTKRALHAVSRCPQRAQYVRTLYIDDPSAGEDLVTALLELLPSLQSLELVACKGMILNPVDDGIPFPFKLKKLRVVADADRLPALEFVQFLALQTELEVLELPGTQFNSARHEALAARASSDPSFLPHLETLCAPPTVLAACLHGRRRLQHLISSIRFTGPRAGGDECGVNIVCTAIRANNADIVSLVIATHNGYDAMIKIADACPRLRSLELGMIFGPQLALLCNGLFSHGKKNLPPLMTHITRFAIHLAKDNWLGSMPSGIETLERHFKTCFPKMEEYITRIHHFDYSDLRLL